MADKKDEIAGFDSRRLHQDSDDIAPAAEAGARQVPERWRTYTELPTFAPPRAANRTAQVWARCAFCELYFAVAQYLLDKGTKCCSTPCRSAHAKATGLFAGAKNPAWKGGVAKDNMRYKRRQLDRFPERVRAREMVRNAIRAGKLVRQPCERCGAAKVEGHHDDYSKPLEVRWLCPRCHDEHHASEATGS